MIKDCKIIRGIKPGQYHNWAGNVGKDRGHPDRCLSRSELMLMLDCGQMFLAGGTRPESESLSFGSLVDCMALTPDELGQYIIQPGTYRSGGEKKKWSARATYCKQWMKDNPGKCPPDEYEESLVKIWNNNSTSCKEWVKAQRAEGRTVVSQKEWDQAAECVRCLRAHDMDGFTIGDLIDECHTQTCIAGVWECPETGMEIPIRALLDMDREGAVYDLKTTVDARPKKFRFSVRDYHYDVQAWLYSAMAANAKGVDSLPFAFVVVRNKPPYLVATYKPTCETLAEGREKFERAMRAYCQALQTGRFKGYTEGFEAI